MVDFGGSVFALVFVRMLAGESICGYNKHFHLIKKVNKSKDYISIRLLESTLFKKSHEMIISLHFHGMLFNRKLITRGKRLQIRKLIKLVFQYD